MYTNGASGAVEDLGRIIDTSGIDCQLVGTNDVLENIEKTGQTDLLRQAAKH